MNVLSLFDGISCGQLALHRANIRYDNYYASEINKHAIKVTQYHFPHTIQLGDISAISAVNLPKTDLLIGGSPCVSFSSSGKKQGMDGTSGKLFFEYIRLLQEISPRYFLLENVVMKKEWSDIISDYMGVQPIEINSALVSAQHRRRLYWTNVSGIEQPKDKNIVVRDIITDDRSDKRKWLDTDVIASTKKKPLYYEYTKKDGCGNNYWEDQRYCLLDGKFRTILSNCSGKIKLLFDNGKIGNLNCIELERLQQLPDNYTSIISDAQRRIAIGNGWSVDVIAHIFSYIKMNGAK
jgi:DNA (cytosine-5)-methyltransferase 3A